MTQKLIAHMNWKSGKALMPLHYRAPMERMEGLLCHIRTEKGNGTGMSVYISRDKMANGCTISGNPASVLTLTYKRSNPSSLPTSLTSLNSLSSVPLSLCPCSPLSLSSSVPLLLSSPLSSRLLFSSLLSLLSVFSSLSRNKHTPELPPSLLHTPELSIITLLKALRLSYMNLSITALRFIDHIPPVMSYNRPNQ